MVTANVAQESVPHWDLELYTRTSDRFAAALLSYAMARKGYAVSVTCTCGQRSRTLQTPHFVSRTHVISRGKTLSGTGYTSGCATAEDVLTLIERNRFPVNFDVLIAPGHMNGFHIVRSALEHYKPSIIATSINRTLGTTQDRVVPYLRNVCWDGSSYFGCSYQALQRLAGHYGYHVYFDESAGSALLLHGEMMLLSQCVGQSNATPALPPGEPSPANASRPYLRTEHYMLRGTSTARTKYGFITYFRNDEFIGSQLSKGLYWQEFLIAQVGQDLRPLSGLALDIGAHVGTHSIALARYAQNLEFVCYEPQRELFCLLERNIAENRLSARIKAQCCAIGHCTSTVMLSGTATDGMGAGRPLEYGSPRPINLGGVQLAPGGQPCKLKRIDDEHYAANVRYIKVDVEGAESIVLEGMRHTVESSYPIVVYENRRDRELTDASLTMLGLRRNALPAPNRYLSSIGYWTDWVGGDCIASPSLVSQLSRGNDELSAHGSSYIPRRIIQALPGATPTPYQRLGSTFLQHNPNYLHDVWDPQISRDFIVTHFPWFVDTYDSYPSDDHRIDVIRYFALYILGGCYADADVECLRPLDDLFDIADIVLGRSYSLQPRNWSLSHAIIVSAPRQVFWLLVMDILLQRQADSSAPTHVAGSHVLTLAADIYRRLDSLAALDAIRRVTRYLRSDQLPLSPRSAVVTLDPWYFHGLNASNPIHRLVRYAVVHGQHVESAVKKATFGNAWMVSYGRAMYRE